MISMFDRQIILEKINMDYHPGPLGNLTDWFINHKIMDNRDFGLEKISPPEYMKKPLEEAVEFHKNMSGVSDEMMGNVEKINPHRGSSLDQFLAEEEIDIDES
jgi:hypothetical protein